MNIETMTPDQITAALQKMADAIAAFARAIGEMARVIMKAITKLLGVLRPYINLWSSENIAAWRRMWIALGWNAEKPPRTWAEAKRRWRKHGRFG
jgi:hypothetical protein